MDRAAPSERKFAVLLFADLSGYTQLCQELDPEDVVATIHPVMTSLHAVTASHGGVICSVAGDGFLAVFGVPEADENAAAHAVRAARAIRAAVRGVNDKPRPVPFPSVHIGVAAGEVLVTPSSEPAGFSMVGPAINLASRLCDAAPGDVILVDETTRSLATGTGRWGEPQSLTVRGHSSAVTVYPADDQDDVDASPVATPPSRFVGRIGTLASLDAQFEDVMHTGRSAVVRIAGEAGIGKTRLVDHWLAVHPEVAAIWVRCDAGSGGGVRDLLHELGPGTGLDAGETELAPAFGAREDPFPAILDATRSRLQSLALEQPTVVVIDDLHLADAMVRALIDDVTRTPVAAPLLLVATWRSGENDVDLGRADHVLGGLTLDESTSVLADTFGVPPTRELAQALFDRAGGHPLMTIHTAAYLAETTAVDVGVDEAKPTTPTALAALPTTVRLSVSARLDRLPAGLKRLLQTMSTCGGPFDAGRAQALTLGALGDFAAALRAGLIVPTGDGRFRFGHAVVQEVAYASLPRSVRAQLHRRQLALPSVAVDPQQRAFHALAWVGNLGVDQDAERQDAVLTALTAVYDHASTLFAVQAQSSWDAIRDVLPLMDDFAERFPELVAKLHTLAASALVEIWQFDDAERHARRARDAASRSGVAVTMLDAALVHGDALTRLRRNHAARQTLDEVIAGADAIDDDRRRGLALRTMALTWRHESYPKFVALNEEAFGTLRAAGADDDAADVARFLAYLTGVAPDRLHQRWLSVATEMTPADDVRGQASLNRTIAMGASYRLDFVTATAAAEIAVELGSRLSAYDLTGDGLLVLVDAAVARGDWDDFVARLTAYAELIRRTGNPRSDLFLATCSMIGLLRNGRLDECLRAYERATAAVTEFGSAEAAEVDYVCALVDRDRGDFATALARLARARGSSADGYFGVEELLHRVHEARISVAAGSDVSVAALEQLERECVEAGAPRLASYAQAVREQAALLRAEPIELTAAPDGVMIEEAAIRADNAVLRARLAGDDDELLAKQSVALWASLGATVWLARAQHLAGDDAAAARTLDVVGANDAARGWALASR